MKVAIYGGAFDPLGKHHLSIANYIILKDIVDEIWIMPCYKSMANKKMADPSHRLNICRIGIECNNNPKIKLCDFEIINKLEIESLEIMKLLIDKYNNYSFYFIMGADNAIKAINWKKFEESINLIPFIIIARTGYLLDSDLWCFNKPHIVLNDTFVIGSSTEIRNNERKDLIYPKIAEYIIEYDLY